MARRNNGEGSIVQRSDGRWQGSLQAGGVRKAVYGRTEREARTKLLALQRELSLNGSLPVAGNTTLNAFLDSWLAVCAPDLKPSTLDGYRQVCDRYIRPTIGKVKLARLTPLQIQRLYAELQGRGSRVASRTHLVLHRALKLAVMWRWLANNPADRVLKPSYRPTRKEMWSTAELQTFLSGTEHRSLHSLWVVILSSGCRLGEALGLHWQEVDWQSGSITIRSNIQRIRGQWVETAPKTRAGERVVSLPLNAVAALRTHKAKQAEKRLLAGAGWQDGGLVFTGATGGPLDRTVVDHTMLRECKRLGLPVLTPHGLRHLHASLLLAGGSPITAVSARLGHANAAITGSIYAHAIQGQDRQAADTIGQALAGGAL